MSEDNRGKVQSFISENIVVFIVGIILAWLSWSNKQQLTEVRLNQEKAILQTQADVASKFVSKEWFQSSSAELHAADTANAFAIAQVAASVAGINTSLAVLASKIETSKSK